MTHKHLYYGILILAVVLVNYQVLGQNGSVTKNPEYTITKKLLTVGDGLASHEVFCGVQDSAGFLWFGTRNGLNRYDGKNCLLFTRQRNNLQENKVVQLAKDDANNLFIEYGSTGFQLTTNGKVDVMNADTKEVKTLTAAFPKLPFKEQDVYWISNDGTDEINFLTANPFRLWKYSTQNGFRLRFEIKDWGKPNSLPNLDFRSTGPLCFFAKGKALLKIFNQSTQYLVSKDTVIAFTQIDAIRSLPTGFNREDDLLITYNTSAEPDSYTVGMVSHLGKSEFPTTVKGFKTDSLKGHYWYQSAASMDGSFCIFYIPSDALYLWNENTFLKVVSNSEIKAFENLSIYQCFPDNLGNLWLCTSTGVVQLRVERNRFEHYFTAKQQSIQTNSQARGIYANETGRVSANIWTYTFGQQKGKMQYVAEANEEIKYALIQHNGTMYCGGYNLFRYDEVKNRISAYPDGQGSEIWSLFSLNDSLLLLGRTNGFMVFNSNTSRFDSLRYVFKNTPEAKFVYRFIKSNDGILWAVAENGLYQLTLKNTTWTAARYQSPQIEGLSLFDAYLDTKGFFWLATNGEGLFRWDRHSNSLRQFNITAGFPSDVLYRIEPDGAENLWISSDYGLIRFRLTPYSITTYTTKDGISNNEFNRTSSFKARDGRLFFGGIDGVNGFYPADFIADTNSLDVPLRIIAFNQFVSSRNEMVDKTTELLKTNKITLNPNDKIFTLEFQLLDFEEDQVHRYSYKIEGLDTDWTYTDESSIRISGLPYGKLILHIKAQNREGVWSKSELRIPLTVLRPFYFQWWFILVAILLFGLGVYLLISFRIKQIAVDKRILEQTVHERTTQLKKSLIEQSALITEKDVLMKEIHHRVKNNLQVISGLLELQSKVLTDETAKDALREGRNRVRSIALIHQNLYQFEDLSTIQLKRFVQDLYRQIEGVFQMQNQVAININVPDINLDIDTAVPLGLIMNELLSNSFKYAFKEGISGEITLSVHAISEGKYRLHYSDTGPGLPADFDIAQTQTLGIQLIYDLSRQIGGSVNYENKNGAFFTINFTNRDVRKNLD
ncbi:histidine kinase dimerization/phosphoacceptor domain -containing protein [Runella aurantiaca]|uniref:histidine kinase n=1 Tax=Runella aurantiaca TaxID=2282308 RepID=A0A369I296_9BACT|nr:histidine kinase dimerization/phosphoacceptor domain -containing protein [Runella aurantiaca]RDB02375.1 hypothetical protein DVG78_28985 [Runella aurantiaca]